jgi:hypothetical protein
MAFTFAEKAVGGSNTGASSYQISSLTYTAGKLYLIGTSVYDASAGSQPTTIATTGAALSWTSVANTNDDLGNWNLSLWRALPAATVTDTVDIARVGTDMLRFAVLEVTGMDTGGTNGASAIVQSKTGHGQGTTQTLTFDANLAAGNARYTLGGQERFSTNLTASSGTWVNETATNGTNISIRHAHNAAPATTDTSAIWTWLQANTRGAVIIAELKLSAADSVGFIPI